MNVLTPIKAIRAKCLDCCCGSALEVRLCGATDCPIYPYRLGVRPSSKYYAKIKANIAENNTENNFEVSSNE